MTDTPRPGDALPDEAIEAVFTLIKRQRYAWIPPSDLELTRYRSEARRYVQATAPAIRDAEREACVREIFDYANQVLAPLIGAAYRDAARLLLRGHPDIAAAMECPQKPGGES